MDAHRAADRERGREGDVTEVGDTQSGERLSRQNVFRKAGRHARIGESNRSEDAAAMLLLKRGEGIAPPCAPKRGSSRDAGRRGTGRGTVSGASLFLNCTFRPRCCKYTRSHVPQNGRIMTGPGVFLLGEKHTECSGVFTLPPTSCWKLPAVGHQQALSIGPDRSQVWRVWLVLARRGGRPFAAAGPKSNDTRKDVQVVTFRSLAGMGLLDTRCDPCQPIKENKLVAIEDPSTSYGTLPPLSHPRVQTDGPDGLPLVF